jgi:anti-anti-sigma factor
MLIELAGEIDMANAGTLGDCLCQAIDGIAGGLVIDMTAVSFLDCSGRAMMIRVHRAASAQGGCASGAVSNPSPRRRSRSSGLTSFWSSRTDRIRQRPSRAFPCVPRYRRSEGLEKTTQRFASMGHRHAGHSGSGRLRPAAHKAASIPSIRKSSALAHVAWTICRTASLRARVYALVHLVDESRERGLGLAFGAVHSALHVRLAPA